MATKKQQGFVQQSTHLMKLLREIAEVRLPEVAVLSEEERSRTPRWRSGFEEEVPSVVDLVKKKQLGLPGFDLEQMQADIAFAEELEPIRSLVASAIAWMQRALDDTILFHRARAWQTFLAYYAMLAKLAERDAEIEDQLKPTVGFMANGPRAKAVSNEDKEPVPVKAKESNG
jgi:hypothetical protein